MWGPKGAFRGRRVFEPKMRGGHNAADIYAGYTPELYAGYEEATRR